MRVFVLNMRGEPLMPTTHTKARILLKLGKAKVYKNGPFTIQLMYATNETKQDVSIGVDSNAKILEFCDVEELANRKDYRREARASESPEQAATIYDLDTKRRMAVTKHQ